MCGIIGIYGHGHNSERAKESLEKIVHRGTQHFEIKKFDMATIGANRLPIVGRNTGNQPISNEDGTIWAVLNGEIFNFVELKKDLEKKGHIFTTGSDTEILPHLYQEYGPLMMDHIDSEMFAFIIYDNKNKKVFAARDPIGVKPLYYAYDTAKSLYFFSELKQVAEWDDIHEIHMFPTGSYYFDGFKEYFTPEISDGITNEGSAQRTLMSLIESAVQKRVQTDLPIAVLLSGGVDSSLIMELATRHHPDVTAIILGTKESADHQAAIKLCQERNWKHKVIIPPADYLKDLDEVIYYAETFEPNIIRHSFASHLCAQAIAKLNICIALVGEGSDELFGGYNEFTEINPEKISEASEKMTLTLAGSHLQRVDRMSMWSTIEVRVPFLDTEIVKFAFSVASDLKVRRVNGIPVTKYILRKAASAFLPEEIAWRYKAPFANGAGMDVGSNYLKEDGEISKHLKEVTFNEPTDTEKQKYNLKTIEDRYYFSKFKEFHYDKLVDAQNRAFMKDTLVVLFK